MWCLHGFKYGLSNVYGSGTNYLPFYHYILWVYGQLAGTEQSINEHINYVRCFTLFFEFAGIYLVWRWIGKTTDFFLLLSFSMLNIAYSYNTVIWGQVDAIEATLIFAALYAAYSGKLTWAGIGLVLALNMKLQAIVFIPIFAFLVFESCTYKVNWKHMGGLIAGIVITQALILWPFMHTKNGIETIYKVAFDSVGIFPRVSLNAYNMWYWIVGKDAINVLDTGTFIFHLTYRKTGLLLFFIGAFAAHYPLLKHFFLRITRKKAAYIPVQKEQIWLIAALTAILFFFLNTEMHERYVHPAFIFLTAYTFYSRRFGPYILFSIAYFLNLESVLRFLKFTNYGTAMFDQRVIAVLFAMVIVWLFVLLYRKPKAIPASAPIAPPPSSHDALLSSI